MNVIDHLSNQEDEKNEKLKTSGASVELQRFDQKNNFLVKNMIFFLIYLMIFIQCTHVHKLEHLEVLLFEVYVGG